MTAKNPIVNPTGDLAWAIEKLNDFAYRKTFGLSEKEFLEETADSFLVNSEILGIIADIERREQKASEARMRK